MQTFGYLTSMLPIVEEMYDTKKKTKRCYANLYYFSSILNRNLDLLMRITSLGLEEARANGDAVDGETINGMRCPVWWDNHFRGDSLIVGTLIPVLLGIALGLSKGSNVAGAIFYIVVWNFLVYFGMLRFAFFKGYQLGDKAVEF